MQVYYNRCSVLVWRGGTMARMDVACSNSGLLDHYGLTTFRFVSFSFILICSEQVANNTQAAK